MLEYAKLHEDKLRQLHMEIAFDPFYQFEQYMAYREKFELPNDTFNSNDFASVYNNEILGLVGYRIKRVENTVFGLNIIHFGGPTAPNGYIFGKDVMTAIKDIFERYHFRKLNFTVVIGNPVEKTYDKLIRRYNGRIAGIKEQETKLIDGKLYDVKEYEILSSKYFANKGRGQ